MKNTNGSKASLGVRIICGALAALLILGACATLILAMP